MFSANLSCSSFILSMRSTAFCAHCTSELASMKTQLVGGFAKMPSPPTSSACVAMPTQLFRVLAMAKWRQGWSGCKAGLPHYDCRDSLKDLEQEVVIPTGFQPPGRRGAFSWCPLE